LKSVSRPMKHAANTYVSCGGRKVSFVSSAKAAMDGEPGEVFTTASSAVNRCPPPPGPFFIEHAYLSGFGFVRSGT
jgi:hypothetical protein